MSTYNDKNIVITGANSGIGLALTEAYLKLGATIIGIDLNTDRLTDLEKNFPQTIKTFQADISNLNQLTAVVEEIKQELKTIYAWVNNAGIAILGKFENLSLENFDKVWKVNFNGTVYGSKLAFNLFEVGEKGFIVNVSSVNGSIPSPFMSSYVASKHAVNGFTRSLALELDQSHSKVKAVLVSPGFVKTQIIRAHEAFEFPEWLEWIVENPSTVAQEIIKGIESGKSEINPTLHGKFLLKMNQIAPELTRKSSRLLVAKNLKEILGIDPIKK